MARVRPAATVSVLACDASSMVYALGPARPLPTLDLSRSLKSELLSARAQARLSAFMRLRGIGAAGVVGSCLYMAALLSPVAIGRVIAVVSAFLYVPSLICGTSLLRYDVVRVLMRHFDFWFVSFIVTTTFAVLGVVLRDVRAIMMVYAWLGSELNIVIDANVRLVKAWAVYMIFATGSFAALWLAVSLDAIHDIEHSALLVFQTRSLSTQDYATAGLATVTALIARNLYRKRHVFCATNRTVIECVSYRTDLRYTPVDLSDRSSSSSDEAVTPAGFARRSTDPRDVVVAPAPAPAQRPKQMTEIRYAKQLRVLHACDVLVPMSWVQREALVPSAPAQSRRVFQYVGITCALATVTTSIASRVAAAPTTVLDRSSDGASTLERIQWSEGAALALTSVYCGTCALHWQRKVLVELCTSFDFVFLSVQLTLVHASVGDFLQWHPRGSCSVVSWWLWIHWVLTLDAMPPVMRVKLGVSKRFVFTVLFVYVAASLALLYDAVPADNLSALYTRVLWRVRIWDRAWELKLIPLFCNCVAVGIVLCVRLISRLAKNNFDVLLVLNGALAYDNYLHTPRAKRRKERPSSCSRCPLGRAQLASTIAPTQYGPLHLSARALSSSAISTDAAHTSESSNSNTSHTSTLLATLDACIAQRECAQALVTLQELESHATSSPRPSTQTLQKLAILLAKQKNAVYTQHAYELLLSVYRSPGFRADDYTTLASIYVVDACLHFRLLDEAVETYEEAFNQGVCLDLAAYDALLAALVAADRTFEAVAILNEVADDDAVAPTEHSYLPLLLALARAREYTSATDLLERGQGRGVTFTGETFNPLVECVEKEEEPTDALVMLLTYIEDIWEDAKLFEALEDQVSDDDDDEEEDDDTEDREDDSHDPEGDNKRV